jgi:hypothetical protein
LKQRTREINSGRIMQFQLKLSNETWKYVYIDNDTNSKFNSFLCAFLIIFEASFPVSMNVYTETRMAGIKRIVFLDFIHRLVSQEQTKLRKLKIIDKRTTIHTSTNKSHTNHSATYLGAHTYTHKPWLVSDPCVICLWTCVLLFFCLYF